MNRLLSVLVIALGFVSLLPAGNEVASPIELEYAEPGAGLLLLGFDTLPVAFQTPSQDTTLECEDGSSYHLSTQNEGGSWCENAAGHHANCVGPNDRNVSATCSDGCDRENSTTGTCCCRLDLGLPSCEANDSCGGVGQN